MSTNAPDSTMISRLTGRAGDPAQQAFLLLRTVFTVAPIAFGLDKFANLLTDWPGYLAPFIDRLVPGTAQQAMYAVGVIEILAGLLVAVRPRYGAVVVAAWLAGIIVNLLILGDFYDVALRDFGLLVAAVALWRLASRRAAESSVSRR
ncbi:hypothetical protein DMB66_02605 [Actinoplanes sp. ATCC 53533]|uniref:hypothetical protein n=1 Tax=Actinoplanes sp. ATCC 53533 TaxID=1288362 RepID=UPI000F795B2F|nr:hypothetical protein [Actinoplanes sp. ATCC 53533]RSM73811.1 hypothetical protein DMB66_02605 [Actinoplanes sp. ATCC 53533]